MSPRETSPLLFAGTDDVDRLRSHSEPASLQRPRKSAALEELTNILSNSDDELELHELAASSRHSDSSSSETHDLTEMSLSTSSTDDDYAVLTRRSRFPINEPRNRKRRSSTATTTTSTKPPSVSGGGEDTITTASPGSTTRDGSTTNPRNNASRNGGLNRRVSQRGRSSTRKKDNLNSSKSSFDFTLDSSKNTLDSASKNTLDSSKNTFDSSKGTLKSSTTKSPKRNYHSHSSSTTNTKGRSATKTTSPSSRRSKGEYQKQQQQQRPKSSPPRRKFEHAKRTSRSPVKGKSRSPKRYSTASGATTTSGKRLMKADMRRSQSAPADKENDDNVIGVRTKQREQQQEQQQQQQHSRAAAKTEKTRGRSNTSRKQQPHQSGGGANEMEDSIKLMDGGSSSTRLMMDGSSTSIRLMDGSSSRVLLNASSGRLHSSASKIPDSSARMYNESSASKLHHSSPGELDSGGMAAAGAAARRRVRSESKSRSTALNMFDKSNSSAESFHNSFCEDETRRMVKEAGFIEASEYIGGPRLSTLHSSKNDSNTSGNGYIRSASLNPRRDSIGDQVSGGGGPRSASLNPNRDSVSGSGDSFYSGSTYTPPMMLNYPKTTTPSANPKRSSNSEKGGNNVRSVSLNPKREKTEKQTNARSASLNPRRDDKTDEFSIIRAHSSPETVPLSPEPKGESHGSEKRRQSTHRPASLNPKRDSYSESVSSPRSQSLKPRREPSVKNVNPRSASLNPKREPSSSKLNTKRSSNIEKSSNVRSRESIEKNLHAGLGPNISIVVDNPRSSAKKPQHVKRESISLNLKKESNHSAGSSTRSSSLTPKRESVTEKVNSSRSASVDPKKGSHHPEKQGNTTGSSSTGPANPNSEINAKEDSTARSASRGRKKKEPTKKRKSKIYFPANPPRQSTDTRRRWSLTGLEMEEDKKKKDVEEMSVGTRQSILDSIASPATSRPALPRDTFQHPQSDRERAHNQMTNKQQQQQQSKSPSSSESSSNVLSPSTLPSLLAPPSDDESCDDDSRQGLLDNISISDLMSSSSKREDLFNRITMDASLTLTDRWEPIPIALPFQEGERRDATHDEEEDDGDEEDREDDQGVETGEHTRDDSPRPEKRDSSRKGRRERKHRPEGGEKQQRQVSPRRGSHDEKRYRGRRKDGSLSRSSQQHPSRRGASNSLSRSKRLSSENGHRSRSNSRSLSQSRSSARARIANALASFKADGESALHRSSTTMETPEQPPETDPAGEETNLSDEDRENPEPVEAPAPGTAGKRSSLTILSLYGSAHGPEIEGELPSELAKEEKDMNSPSLAGPMHNSLSRDVALVDMDNDLDNERHRGGRSRKPTTGILKVQSEPGERVRTNSRDVRDRSRSKDREAMKRDGRNRLAKERRSGRMSTGGENEYGNRDSDFGKSDSDFTRVSNVSMSDTDQSNEKNQQPQARGVRNKNPQQRLRGRRNTVGHHMLHSSLNSSIPDLEPMSGSGHSSGPINMLPSVREQVWQKRRRQSVGVGGD